MSYEFGREQAVTLHEFNLFTLQLCKDLHLARELVLLDPNLVKLEVMHSIRQMDDTLVRMCAKVPEVVLEDFVVKYPLNWWEAVKERFFPAIALAYWPVKFEIRKFRASSILPKFYILPGSPRLIVREMK